MEEDDISIADVIASTIHDMKNSLNIQIESLESLATQYQSKDNDSINKQIWKMIYEANRMNGNLIQILCLYKMGKSIYPINISEQSVKEMISEVTSQYESIMHFKGIDLNIECDENCYGYFDRDLVAGVLINAINNAYNYTSDKIRIAAKLDGGFLEIRVEDNGKGYPESFFMGEVSANKGISFTTGSTGLGFYFSSHVASMHKNGDKRGTINIENGGTYGGGCFILRLP